MPLDAVCLQAVVAELAPQITGSRIEKIQQPARDQVVLLLRGNRRLLLSAGGGQPRPGDHGRQQPRQPYVPHDAHRRRLAASQQRVQTFAHRQPGGAHQQLCHGQHQHRRRQPRHHRYFLFPRDCRHTVPPVCRFLLSSGIILHSASFRNPSRGFARAIPLGIFPFYPSRSRRRS